MYGWQNYVPRCSRGDARRKSARERVAKEKWSEEDSDGHIGAVRGYWARLDHLAYREVSERMQKRKEGIRDLVTREEGDAVRKDLHLPSSRRPIRDPHSFRCRHHNALLEGGLRPVTCRLASCYLSISLPCGPDESLGGGLTNTYGSARDFHAIRLVLGG